MSKYACGVFKSSGREKGILYSMSSMSNVHLVLEDVLINVSLCRIGENV